LLRFSEHSTALRQRQRALIPTFSPRAGRRSAQALPLQPPDSQSAATALAAIGKCFGIMQSDPQKTYSKNNALNLP
jgi:hypothetical protein